MPDHTAEYRLTVYRTDPSGRSEVLDVTLDQREWDAIRFEIHATLAGLNAPDRPRAH